MHCDPSVLQSPHARLIPLFWVSLLLCAAPLAVGAADLANSNGFFVQGNAQYYVLPGLPFHKPFSRPIPGVRVTVGWELWNFSLGVETGITRIRYDSAPGSLLSLIPVALRLDYGLTLNEQFGMRFGGAGGILFSNNEMNSGYSFFAGPRIYGEWYFSLWDFSSDRVSLCFGGGADIMFEGKGLIFLPSLDIGIRARAKKSVGSTK